MTSRLRRPAVMLALGIVVARGTATRTQQRSVDEFFSSFTEWMRANPNRAASTRHVTGPGTNGILERAMDGALN